MCLNYLKNQECHLVVGMPHTGYRHTTFAAIVEIRRVSRLYFLTTIACPLIFLLEDERMPIADARQLNIFVSRIPSRDEVNYFQSDYPSISFAVSFGMGNEDSAWK